MWLGIAVDAAFWHVRTVFGGLQRLQYDVKCRHARDNLDVCRSSPTEDIQGASRTVAQGSESDIEG
jgi:hypothetical protein